LEVQKNAIQSFEAPDEIISTPATPHHLPYAYEMAYSVKIRGQDFGLALAYFY